MRVIDSQSGAGIIVSKSSTLRNATQSAAVAMALLASLACPAVAVAGSVGVTVNATILKHASLQVLAQPFSVEVTPLDIARGYVDVPARARVVVKNNTAGYMLVFAGEGEFVRQVRVSGLGADVQMGAGGGVVTRSTPGRGMNSTVLELGFRFELATDTQQGVYPWPIQMSVVPL